MTQIGTKIRKIREIKDLSQEYMADKLKMSQQAYSKIERNEAKLDIGRIQEIADVMEVDVVTLLTFDEQQVINAQSHHQTGGICRNGYIIESNDFEKEREALQNHIAHLESEITFLRSLLKGYESSGQ